MFRHFLFLKLLTTVTLGVLLLLPLVPVTSVVSQPPPALPSRVQIVNSLSQAMGAVLTATGDEILLDMDKAVFLSEFKETVAFVPLHEAYWPRVQALFDAMLERQIDSIPVGGLAVVEPIKTIKGPDGPGFALREGTYMLWWSRSENDLVVTDKEGNKLGAIKGGVTIKFGAPSVSKLSRPWVRMSTKGEFLVVEIETNWMWPVANKSVSGLVHLENDRHFALGALVAFVLLCVCGQ